MQLTLGPNDHGSVMARLGNSSVTVRSQLSHSEVTAQSRWSRLGHSSITAQVTAQSRLAVTILVTVSSLWTHHELTVSSLWTHHELTVSSWWAVTVANFFLMGFHLSVEEQYKKANTYIYFSEHFLFNILACKGISDFQTITSIEILCFGKCINPSWPDDVKGHQRSKSLLVHVKLVAYLVPNHYLNKWWVCVC